MTEKTKTTSLPPLPSDLPIQTNVPLAPKTTLGVGGAAAFFASVASMAELRACLTWAKEQGLPTFFLGGGSNLVVADRGLSGLVIRWTGARLRRLSSVDEPFSFHTEDGLPLLPHALAAGATEDRTRHLPLAMERDDTLDAASTGHSSAAEPTLVGVEAEAGLLWDNFVLWAVEQNFAGVECLSGIPGFLGAAPIQNIGAYGQEICETFVSAEVFDTATQTIEVWDRRRCGFAYRHSALKSAKAGRFFVLSIRFALRLGGEGAVRYAELRKLFPEGSLPPSLPEIRKAVMALRKSKSMLLDPSDPDARSAGSFFMNPIVSNEDAEEAWGRLRSRLPSGAVMPQFAVPDKPGSTKLAAGWLIEACGLPKGTHHGAVGLSQKHALAIVNRGGATASAILAFASHIKQTVASACGIALTPEPVFLGFTKEETRFLFPSEEF